MALPASGPLNLSAVLSEFRVTDSPLNMSRLLNRANAPTALPFNLSYFYGKSFIVFTLDPGDYENRQRFNAGFRVAANIDVEWRYTASTTGTGFFTNLPTDGTRRLQRDANFNLEVRRDVSDRAYTTTADIELYAYASGLTWYWRIYLSAIGDDFEEPR